MFLLLANVLMLFVGCFLEPTAAITILVPILVPICQQLGIDPVHFGLVMVLNLMIGLLHPPMGMVLFVLARVAKLVGRAHHDRDPALAGAAAAVAGDHDVRPEHLAVAAQDVLLIRGGTGRKSGSQPIEIPGNGSWLYPRTFAMTPFIRLHPQ